MPSRPANIFFLMTSIVQSINATNLKKISRGNGWSILTMRDYQTGLEFIRNLDNPDNNFMGISILIKEVEFYHGIILPDVAFNIYYLIILEMFFYFLLENKQSICKIYF